MSMTNEELARISEKGKTGPVLEEFSVTFDSVNHKVTLRVNGVERTFIKSKFAETIFEKMLKIAKYKFIKLRERFTNN